jgi:hypothetical protein
MTTIGSRTSENASCETSSRSRATRASLVKIAVAVVFCIAMLRHQSALTASKVGAEQLGPLAVWSGFEQQIAHVNATVMSYYERVRFAYEMKRELEQVPPARFSEKQSNVGTIAADSMHRSMCCAR